MYFPAGSRCTYVAEYETEISGVFAGISLWDVPDIIGRVTSDIANNESLTVEAQRYNNPLSSAKTSITLSLLTTLDRNDIEDVRRVTDHYFYTESGYLPNASRITDYKLVATPENPNPQSQQTGAPAPPPKPPDNPGGLGNLSLPNLNTFAYVALFAGLGVIALLVLTEHYL